MKRIFFLAALLLTMVAPAHAQLNIKKVGEVPKQMAVLQLKWNWLYSIGESIYFVSATSNQFDDLIWIKLGDTKTEAAESVKQLIATVDEITEDDFLELNDREGEQLYLRLYKAFGKRYGLSISSTKRAGEGYIYLPALKKALQTLNKEMTLDAMRK